MGWVRSAKVNGAMGRSRVSAREAALHRFTGNQLNE
jgi:hypothetical protein